MHPNVLLPLLCSALSFVFALFLLDQWLERRRSYQLIWTIGMVWYGISAGTEFWGGAFGWSEPLYRAWYLIGAVYVAAWLGLGTMYLLGRTRFGYGAAFSVLLAGLFTLLSQAKAQYTDTGMIPEVGVRDRHRRRHPDHRSRRTAAPGRWAWIAGVPDHRRIRRRGPDRADRRRSRLPATCWTPPGSRWAPLMPGSVRLLTPAVQRHRRVRARPGRPLQHLRVHAQEAA